MERELTAPVLLCDARGRLNAKAVGWSRRPLHTCNLACHWPRKKRWNYWCITSERSLFSATVTNLDYAAMAFVYWLEFASGRFVEQTVLKPLGRNCVMGDTIDSPVRFESKQLDVAFDTRGERTEIAVTSSDFGGRPMSAQFVVTTPAAHETMNVVIPWSDRRFQYTSKHQCLPVAGRMRCEDETDDFPQGGSFACLDFGRGIWPYASSWNWAAFSTVCDGRAVGVNLGGRWTDGTGYTENALVVGGRISKLPERMEFGYDCGDFKRPWAIRSASGTGGQGNVPDGTGRRVDLEFVPFYERVAKSDLVLLKSTVHQLIGRFSGTIVTDDGETIEVRDAIGWAEEHVARW
ncbi:MAG: DUF2804 domain-containing protein [Chloroflexota bacterium]